MKKNLLLVLSLCATSAWATIFIDFEEDPIPVVDINVYLPISLAAHQPAVAAHYAVLGTILENGTVKKTRAEFLDALGSYAASLSFSVNTEYSQWSLSFPHFSEKDYAGLIELVSENWMEPRFDQNTFLLAQTKLRASLVGSLDNDFSLLTNTLRRYHSFKNLNIYPVMKEDVESLTLSGVRTRFMEQYHASYDVWVGVVAPKELKPLVEKLLSSVFRKQGQIVYQRFNKQLMPRLASKLKLTSEKTFLLIDKPGREQAVMGLMALGAEPMNFDHEIPFVFGNHMLTENGFGSHFMNQIRTERGLAYSVGSIGRYYYFRPVLGFIANPQGQRVEEALQVVRDLVEESYVSGIYFDKQTADFYRRQWQSYIYSKRIGESTASGRLANRLSVVSGRMGAQLAQANIKDRPPVSKVKQTAVDYFSRAAVLYGVVGDDKTLTPLLQKYFPEFKIVRIPFQQSIESSYWKSLKMP